MTQRPAKAKAKTAAPKTKAMPSEKALINECVIYAQSIAAARFGYHADPDGGCKHAEELVGTYETRAGQALTKITVMTASTPAGLEAKARIMPARNSGPVAAPNFEALGKSYQRLENSVANVRGASIVLETVIEGAITAHTMYGPYKQFHLTEDQVTSLFFAMYNLGDFTRALHKEYFAGFGENPDGDVTIQSSAESKVAS